MLVDDIIRRVEGWLTLKEGRLLYNLARKSKKCIVEIGAWKGKSTICLALGSAHGFCVPVITVDHFHGSKEHGRVDTFKDFVRNVTHANVDKYIVVYKMKSADAAEKFGMTIDLLFIDGSHEYEDVKTDYRLWTKKLVKGGVLAMHDSNWPGVRAVIRNFMRHDFKRLKKVDSIVWGRKN